MTRTTLEFCRAYLKVSYDKRSAVTAKNKRWKDEHIRLRIYQCPHCNFWHLTKQLNEPETI